jgi:hypothetical protein
MGRLVIVAVSAIAVLVPAGAMALSAPRAHPVDFKLYDAKVMSGGNRGTTAGVLSGKPFGSGAVVERITVTSVNRSVATTKVAFTIFTTQGTLEGIGRSTRTTNANGTVTLVGTRTVGGGTGAYRAARGRLTLHGRAATNGITTSRWAGRLRY